MKTHVILFLLLITALSLVNCDDNTNNSKDEGRIVFYTVVQAKLNCGPFNVDIFIENDSIGSISEPYLDDTPPECKNSALTVMLEKQTGVYKYTAKMDCGQYGQWTGEFEILPDSCSKVFLDIDNCNPKQL
jgi:hypothetical protein